VSSKLQQSIWEHIDRTSDNTQTTQMTETGPVEIRDVSREGKSNN